VYQRRLGGFAELAAEIRSEGETELPVKMLGLPLRLENPVNGKWSLPLGHPLSQ
jgi:hypothetical protein